MIKKSRCPLFVVGLLLLGGLHALAHPGVEKDNPNDQPTTTATTSTTSTTTPIAAAPLSLNPDHDALECAFDLFTQLAYDAPSPLWQDLINHAMPLQGYLDKLPWGPQGDVAQEAMIHETQTFTHLLRTKMTVIRLTWDNERTSLTAPTEPVELAAGLPRPVLLEVENRTAAPLNLVPRLAGCVAPVPPPVAIPAGAIRLMAFRLKAPMDAAPTTAPTRSATPTPTPALAIESDTVTLACIRSLALHLIPDGVEPRTRQVGIPVTVRQPAIIKGRLLDKDTGTTFPGRVWVKGGDGFYRFGKAFAGNTTLSEKPIIQVNPRPKLYKLPFFYSDGSFEVAVPPGTVELTLERGFESPFVTETITVKPGEVKEVTLASSRFRDMKKEGWISGDTHIHWAKNSWDTNEDIALLAMVQRAEDLRVVNNLTLKHNAPPNISFIAPTQFPMGPVPGYCDANYHIQMGEEYRNEEFYGHLCLLNIQQLIAPISTGAMGACDDWPLNKVILEETHRQGGIATEAHGVGRNWDVPVDVIHGLADMLDQINPDDYYRFLDCGFHLPLGNGSDHPARVAGCARLYVKVDGDFTYEKWIDGIRAGRTFTTSGPLLLLKVNGHDIGDRIEAEPGETLKIEAQVISRKPVGNFQIVSNGKVLREAKIEDTAATMTLELKADEPRWIVARCAPGPAGAPGPAYSAIAAPDVAHTSAIYVNVEGKGVFKPEAARSFVKAMKDHSADIAQRAHFANDGQRQAAIDWIDSGVTRYLDLIKKNTPTAP